MMEKQWGLKPETENIRLYSQECSINHAENILTIVIREPFYSAGKKLGWSYENTVGVGVNPKIFGYCINNHLMLKIQVDGYNYLVNPNKIYKLCKSNRWFWRCNNTNLLVVPMAIMR